MSKPDNAFVVRASAAIDAGEVAARFRKNGLTPKGEGNPDDYGAYQWAEACGFADSVAIRSIFAHSFLAALRA